MGGSRPGNPLLSGESDPVAESCGRAARPLAAATGARDCAPPAVAGARGAPLRSTNPATTGCPAAAADCRRSQPCESRGEWRSHSSGRRVVAASVLVSRRLAHDAGSRMKKCQVTFRKTPSKPARGQEV